MIGGIDMDWAAFHVVEAMSMSKFAHKKIGYLAASLSFHDGTDVLLLITNQLRKDLGSNNEYESGLALECLSIIATPDLAQQLTPDVFSLLASGRVYVRSRASVVIFKLFTKYPDAVRIACKRLVEKLEDTDPKVLSATISVFCEMALKDPASCIPLAPEFYRLLTEPRDNWLLIKVVKIFGLLLPLEPRLSRKVAEPLCEIMRHTTAKSLLLECIRAVTVGLPDHGEGLKLAVQKLKELLMENDPNLKYLGLQALAALMPAHSWAVAENKSIIIRGLNDDDYNIQLASLQLILGMVSEDNLIDTVHVLLQYAERSEVSFCNEVIGSILTTCSRGVYELVSDFTWYTSILGRVSRIRDSAHGKEIERQFVDIGLRVKEVRPDLLAVARGILLDSTLLECPPLYRVLSAAAWIAGEYVEFSHNAIELIEALLQPRIRLLPPAIQAVYLHSVLKVFIYSAYTSLKGVYNEGLPAEQLFSEKDEESTPLSQHLLLIESEVKEVDKAGIVSEEQLEVNMTDDASMHSISIDSQKDIMEGPSLGSECEQFKRLFELIESNVGPMIEHSDVEVQERACNLLGLAKALKEALIISEGIPVFSQSSSMDNALEIVSFLRSVFGKELGPVSAFAQSRVAVPEGLVLMKNLDNLDGMFCDDEVKEKSLTPEFKTREWEVGPKSAESAPDTDSKHGESSSLLAQHRQRHGTYYLPVEKDITAENGYPPPQIVQQDIPSTSSAADDIMKLAEQSLTWSKPRQTKQRPVIVRLDDGDEDLILSSKVKRDAKDNLISSALKDVLVSGKGKPSMKFTSKEDGKSLFRSQQHDHNAVVEVNSNVSVNSEEATKKSGKRHGKHRHKTRSTSMSIKDTAGPCLNQSQGDSHNSHSGQKSRHKSRTPTAIIPQPDVIPDFLS
ncbi:hypothetical protein KP509_26G024900 [Ceratopteris richardii]|nr:hypothetical protein KP509_26G024900 [Ceratopteris richardii]